MNTLKNLFGNKVFRVCFVLLIITFPFASRYELIRTVGESMQPTFADGEWIILERKISLGGDWTPRRFDVVIINNDEENLTKRIVGLPGDSIGIKRGVVFLNGKELKSQFEYGKLFYYPVDENNEFLTYEDGPNMGEPIIILEDSPNEQVPVGYVWVIGDNRNVTWFGLLPIKNIMGKILY